MCFLISLCWGRWNPLRLTRSCVLRASPDAVMNPPTGWNLTCVCLMRTTKAIPLPGRFLRSAAGGVVCRLLVLPCLQGCPLPVGTQAISAQTCSRAAAAVEVVHVRWCGPPHREFSGGVGGQRKAVQQIWLLGWLGRVEGQCARGPCSTSRCRALQSRLVCRSSKTLASYELLHFASRPQWHSSTLTGLFIVPKRSCHWRRWQAYVESKPLSHGTAEFDKDDGGAGDGAEFSVLSTSGIPATDGGSVSRVRLHLGVRESMAASMEFRESQVGAANSRENVDQMFGFVSDDIGLWWRNSRMIFLPWLEPECFLPFLGLRQICAADKRKPRVDGMFLIE